jgi:hypothetical protein
MEWYFAPLARAHVVGGTPQREADRLLLAPSPGR